jgi:hypothetical protein
MSEDEKENEENIENERKKLKELGVESTWDLLTGKGKKEK